MEQEYKKWAYMFLQNFRLSRFVLVFHRHEKREKFFFAFTHAREIWEEKKRFKSWSRRKILNLSYTRFERNWKTQLKMKFKWLHEKEKRVNSQQKWGKKKSVLLSQAWTKVSYFFLLRLKSDYVALSIVLNEGGEWNCANLIAINLLSVGRNTAK